MKYILSILFIISMLFSPLTIQGHTRRALVIGLGEQLDKNWAKINGDKDVPYVTQMLRKCGYKDITTLVNKQATKSGIVSAFNTLTSRCKKGDIVYIHYSGHGQQVSDVNGDEKSDNWDESWIPYDAYLQPCKNDNGDKHLIDDEIVFLLNGIKNKIGSKGKLLVVVDACHSGDSDRDVTPPGEDSIVVRGVFNRFILPVKKNKQSQIIPRKWLTLSACKSGELNQELTKPHVGRLTYALFLLVDEGGISMEKIKSTMRQNPTARRQNPELTNEQIRYKISDVLR